MNFSVGGVNVSYGRRGIYAFINISGEGEIINGIAEGKALDVSVNGVQLAIAYAFGLGAYSGYRLLKSFELPLPA